MKESQFTVRLVHEDETTFEELHDRLKAAVYHEFEYDNSITHYKVLPKYTKEALDD